MKGKFLPFSFVKVSISVLSWWQLTPSRKLRCRSLKGPGIRGSFTSCPFATAVKSISAVQIGISYYMRVQHSKQQSGNHQCLWSRGNPIVGQIVIGKAWWGGQIPTLGNSSPPQCLRERESGPVFTFHLPCLCRWLL